MLNTVFSLGVRPPSVGFLEPSVGVPEWERCSEETKQLFIVVCCTLIMLFDLILLVNVALSTSISENIIGG